MGRGPVPERELIYRGPLSPHRQSVVVLCCISPPFGRLSTTPGKVIHVLLTRAPLYRGLLRFSCDLHVLGAPLTFALSQDQTLQLFLLLSERPRRVTAFASRLVSSLRPDRSLIARCCNSSRCRSTARLCSILLPTSVPRFTESRRPWISSQVMTEDLLAT